MCDEVKPLLTDDNPSVKLELARPKKHVSVTCHMSHVYLMLLSSVTVTVFWCEARLIQTQNLKYFINSDEQRYNEKILAAKLTVTHIISYFFRPFLHQTPTHITILNTIIYKLMSATNLVKNGNRNH